MLDPKNMTNKEKLEHARTCYKLAKIYADTTDYEAARSWIVSAHKFYCACEQTTELLPEKGKCELLLIEINDRCGRDEDALRAAEYAYETYSEIVKTNKNELPTLDEIASTKHKLQQRVDSIKSANEERVA